MDPFSLMLVLLVIALFAVSSGIVLWRSNKTGKSTEVMGCGNCGYPVRGLKSFECPECGADLRKAGINKKQMNIPRFIGILMVCAGGSTLMAIILLFVLAWSPGRYTPPIVAPTGPGTYPNDPNPF